jgi:hypothetical protein
VDCGGDWRIEIEAAETPAKRNAAQRSDLRRARNDF